LCAYHFFSNDKITEYIYEIRHICHLHLDVNNNCFIDFFRDKGLYEILMLTNTSVLAPSSSTYYQACTLYCLRAVLCVFYIQAILSWCPNLHMSTLFTTFFLLTSLQFILKSGYCVDWTFQRRRYEILMLTETLVLFETRIKHHAVGFQSLYCKNNTVTHSTTKLFLKPQIRSPSSW